MQMTAHEIYRKILADLQRLNLEKYEYLSGINSLTKMTLDIPKEHIYVFRGAKRISIDFKKLEAAAYAFESLKPVDFNDLFSSSGSARTVLETLLSYLPNIGFIPGKSNRSQSKTKTGTKKLIWFTDEMHPIGERFDATQLATSTTNQATSAMALTHICSEFSNASQKLAQLSIEKSFTNRFAAALLAKRFLILTGLSGSGKTKIAQAFSQWLTPTAANRPTPYYALVPVGADWIGNENILGYPNGLEASSYMTRQALDLMIHAHAHADVPHFLILDEMNLSHVERYFADILSAIESEDAMPLYEGPPRKAATQTIPNRISMPKNLFIIGTVNVDETTYMFSPKVLDRANVIEFRMAQQDIDAFLAAPCAPNLAALQGAGAHFGRAFVSASADKTSELPENAKAPFAAEMQLLFGLLQEHNLEFGYRTAYEAARFVRFFHLLGDYATTNNNNNNNNTAAANIDLWFPQAMDAVVIQKILPKLHGSRAKLEGLLWALAWFCGANRDNIAGKDFTTQLAAASKADDDAQYGPELVWERLAKIHPTDPPNAAPYPMSFAKVMRMWRRLIREQFVTFTEA
jgi:energy-coupling factor transporter ATP-binding protein EcfA2